MLVPFQGEAHMRRKAPLAALIMLATIVIAILILFNLETVMLGGAITMILAGCISPGQAYRAIDARIFVFIAGAIPLGTAMQTTGVSDLVAQWLQQLVAGWSPFFILLAIFIVVGIVTQFLSDAATTALFGPLAAALALALGHRPEAYVVTVAMASVASLLTPIGHHGNLLIYGIGGYRFTDFVRVGTPLTFLIGLVVVTISPMLWPI
jgi:di/tricarboxylate transporter